MLIEKKRNMSLFSLITMLYCLFVSGEGQDFWGEKNLVNFAITIYRAKVCRALSAHNEITQHTLVAKCIKLKAKEFKSVIGLFVILDVSSMSETNNQQPSFSYTVHIHNGTLRSESSRQTAAQMNRTSASVSVIHV